MRRTPLHIARVAAADPSDVEVLETYEIAYGFIGVATELWQLAGRADRAKEIDGVVTSAYELEPPQLTITHQRALCSLLDGLENALVGTVTDEQHMLTREQISPLRERAKVVDLDESWGVDACFAIQSALVYVDHLRDILDEALALDAVILFD